MLKDKCVIIGVTGSIAAYKAADLVSRLIKLHCDVHVIMTENAANIINPITFETLTNHKCLIDTFDRNFNYNVEHVSLAGRADLLMVAPATANVIGKLSAGICDDMLTTTAMACTCKKIIAPAMNTRMYNNQVLQDNLNRLKGYGMEIIEPESGRLACGEEGQGKFPDTDILLSYILKEIQFKEKILSGKKVLVTAGGTREAIDPVRFISNHSTGKMGYALSEAAAKKGAEVTLVTASENLRSFPFINTIKVNTAKEMFDAVTEISDGMDIIIKAAAVADYRPASVSSEKIKKQEGELSLLLEKTDDILKYLGEHKKEGQFLCGFSMETENLIENSRRKLEKKNLDMIAANNLRLPGAGFGVDTNVITLITRDGIKELPLMSKGEAAALILDEITKIVNHKEHCH